MHVTVALGGGGEWEKSKVSEFLLSYVQKLGYCYQVVRNSQREDIRMMWEDIVGSLLFVSQSTKESRRLGEEKGLDFWKVSSRF